MLRRRKVHNSSNLRPPAAQERNRGLPCTDNLTEDGGQVGRQAGSRHTAYVHTYIYEYIHTSMHACMNAQMHPSIHPSLRPSVRPSVHPSTRPSVHPSRPSVPSIRPSVHPSIRPSMNAPACISACNTVFGSDVLNPKRHRMPVITQQLHRQHRAAA